MARDLATGSPIFELGDHVWYNGNLHEVIKTGFTFSNRKYDIKQLYTNNIVKDVVGAVIGLAVLGAAVDIIKK